VKEIRFMVTYEIGEIVYDKVLERDDEIKEIHAEFTSSGVSIRYVLKKNMVRLNASNISKRKN
jgi:hypothetical protein